MYGDAFVSDGTKGSIYILSIFCRYSNRDYVKLRTVRKNRLVNIRRDVLYIPPVLTRKSKVIWQLFYFARMDRMCMPHVTLKLNQIG
jgi:hypothetical protein